MSAGSAQNRIYMPYGVGANGLTHIVERDKVLHDFSDPVRPTTEEMLSPHLGYISLSPDQGGHSAFPVYGVPVPGFRRGFTRLNQRDILIVVSEAGANSCFGEGRVLALLVELLHMTKPLP